MANDRTAHLRAAARGRAERTLARAQAALERLAAGEESLSVARLAAAAGVSRSWLYTQPALLERIAALAAQRPPAHPTRPPAAQRASSASLIRRLELAHRRIDQLTEENRRLRAELELAYGERRRQARTSHAVDGVRPVGERDQERS